MPSPTEQQLSAETLTLPLKDSMEQSQEIVSHVNDPDDPDEPHDDDEVTNLDDNQQPHEEQQQKQDVTTTTSTSNPSSPSEIIKSTDIVTDDNANVISSTTTSPPVVDIVDIVDIPTTTTTATTTTTTTSTPPPTTITTTTQETTQDVKQEDTTTTTTTQQDTTTQDTTTQDTTTHDTTTQNTHDTPDINKSSSVNGQKRKYTKRVTNDSHPPRRRTRNNSKTGSINSDEQSTKRVPTSTTQVTTTTTTSRRSNVDPNSPSEFSGSNGRKLPSKEGINQTNISDRFVDFIMYCNPSAPETLDKAALVRSFNAVPKSDGKVFQTWSLYQLVGKHYGGEIRTWTKLAQKLGVVRTPEASPQKIQQYAVRLKKWMASVHVDAYFDYLLSRTNEYYQHPHKNPTEGTDDESDVVLKLIKRAGSKRQKRKYTRKNTNTSNTSNDDGAHSRDAMDLDDDAQFETDDEGDDKHRGKRVKGAMYTDDDNEGTEEEDRDPWGEMEVDDDGEEGSERPTAPTGPTNQRRKSVVQFAIEPKNGSDIPTPNPSPTTTLPIMSHSSGNVTGNKGVLNSHYGTTGGAGKLRWRYISTGPAHAVKSSDESYLTTSSPSSSQKDSKKKQDASQVRDTRQSSTTRPSRNVPNEQQQQQQQQQQQKITNQNFADLLVPRTGSNDKETIDILTKKLVSAVGMLEDSQRQINMLNGLVRQRDEDVRQRVVRALKTEVNSVIDRFH